MKHTLIMGFLLMVAVPFAQSQIRQRRAPVQRFHARHVIRRTVPVIVAAQVSLRQTRSFSGKFARAVFHQRLARAHYRRGNYVRAIAHSRRARMLAFECIRLNKGAIKSEWEFDQDELAVFDDLPDDKTLDADVPGDLKDENYLEDKLDDLDVED